MGNTYHAKVNQKKATVAIFISDKINFKANTISRNRDFFIMAKCAICQEDIIIINLWAPNNMVLNVKS